MSAIVNWFLTWWLRSGRYGWSKLYRRIYESKYLSTTLPEVNTLTEIQGCLKKINWTMDGPLHLYDSISYPETVWARKKDDCDGFAILSSTLLHKWIPNSKSVLLTVIIRPVKRSHTVCVFSLPGKKLRVFDNASLHDEEYDTYTAIMSKISKNKGRLVCWDVRDPQTFDIVEFHKA
jgi:hypothetical protein